MNIETSTIVDYYCILDGINKGREMFTILLQGLTKLVTESLQGQDGKYSSKKLTLLVVVCMYLLLHGFYIYVYVKACKEFVFDDFKDLLVIDVVLLGAILGLNVYQVTNMSGTKVSDHAFLSDTDLSKENKV